MNVLIESVVVVFAQRLLMVQFGCHFSGLAGITYGIVVVDICAYRHENPLSPFNGRTANPFVSLS